MAMKAYSGRVRVQTRQFFAAVTAAALLATAFTLVAPSEAAAAEVEFEALATFNLGGIAQDIRINEAGDVSGSYNVDGQDKKRGFVRRANGEITTIEVKRASPDSPGVRGTFVVDLNDAGQVTGGFGIWGEIGGHGFVSSFDGEITRFDVPGALFTSPEAINDAGTITGTYQEALATPRRGFIRAADGTFTTFDVPGATWTRASVMNNGGVIAGTYSDGASERAFVRATDGTFETFVAGNGTQVAAINESGAVTGTILRFTNEAYVRQADGTITILDRPAEAQPGVTNLARDINDAGDVVGLFRIGSSGRGWFQGADAAPTTVALADKNPTRLYAVNNSRIAVGGYSGFDRDVVIVNLNQADGPTCEDKPVTIDMRRNGGNGIGTVGDDVILGTPGNDTIQGGGGNDTICSLGGDDTVDGGAGDDVIRGGKGNDVLRGGAGADTIYGDAGQDVMAGGDGADFLGGGADPDRINAGPGADTVYGGAGADILRGGDDADVIAGGTGDDRVYGNAGDDSLVGGQGDDQLDGGVGDDSCKGSAGIDAEVGCETTASIP